MPHNKIQAIEAATGELIWEYQYAFPPPQKCSAGPTRNIALWQDRYVLATYDAALVAIDAASGKQILAHRKSRLPRSLYPQRRPLVAAGVVVSGINGCELFTKDGCFITGHDPKRVKTMAHRHAGRARHAGIRHLGRCRT